MEQTTCRTCLRTVESETAVLLSSDYSLLQKIKTISSVEISLDDNLPKTVCPKCVLNVYKFYTFRKIVIISDKSLKERYLSQSEANDATASKDGEEKDGSDSKPVTFDSSSVIVKSEFESELIADNAGSDHALDLEDTKNFIPQTSTRHFENEAPPKVKRKGCKPKHLVKHTQPVPQGVCNVCGKSMRADNIKKHEKSHFSSPALCKICGKTFKNDESLRRHKYAHKGDEFKCTICGKVYTRSYELTRHTQRQHEGRIPPKTLSCSICGKAFAYKKSLTQHLLSHTGERPYPCEYCKKGFSSTYALKTHIRQHTNERPYICEYCPMAFPQKVSLKTHIKSKHAKDEITSDVTT